MKSRGKLVCVGFGPALGCGTELSASRRPDIESTCDYCALDWYERVKAWRFGRADPICDEMLSSISGH